MLTFGVEIECLVPYTQRRGLQAKMTAAGVNCVDIGRYHSGLNRTAWKIERDGSLLGDANNDTIEFVSPPLTLDTAGFEQVEKVCRVFEQIGASVNRTCGLHVHIGVGNLPVAAIRKLAELYARHEGLIDQLIPPSRRANANHYCQSIATMVNYTALARANTVRDISYAVSRDSKHVKLNLSSFWRYSTVEFRHHSGTVDASKIIKWVSFCAKMVETAIREQDLPVDAGAPVAVSASSSSAPRYWRTGRARRVLFGLLSRPEGVTAEEARAALGVNQAPYLQGHLRRAGATEALTPVTRRNGQPVFRLTSTGLTTTTTTTVPAPLTLAELWDKLGLTDEDKEFWRERAAILSQGTRRQRQSTPSAIDSNEAERRAISDALRMGGNV